MPNEESSPNPPDADDGNESPAESVGGNRGSTESFQQIFDDISGGLRRFLASRLRQTADVDDCLQSVFLAMTQHGDTVAPAARRAWLFRVAANESAKFWRKQSSTEKMIAAQNPRESIDQDPALPIIHDEARQAVQHAIENLSPTYREMIELRINENLTFQQIADQLNIPIGTALTRMRRALQRLRDDLAPEDASNPNQPRRKHE
ncbi:ECF RNA polymerase sigma factor SigW [Rubripirellula lacrimiformis]|uniref:ECF RNA polymerase sigma factor SigW n=1 Tax=Rubripirellula lacrimiformis TaxID=1930273 RepID=A0A517N5R9_9BACT|nr:sigma-70 family RNA polymerase sigma factor [Rubripirellula lacrimiformis]QDT02463.1 ECF RNA polymerase sigma factor SigW [Rubripirellula lacrimiformis]